MLKRSVRFLKSTGRQVSINPRKNVVISSEAKLDDPGKVLWVKLPHCGLRLTRDFPLVVQKTLLNYIIGIAERHRVTKVEIRPGLDDGQIHVDLSGVRDDLLYFGNGEIALCIYDLAGF
ncbi:hypothetical protein [uncultured Roseobacter sp.]|uniref:hypothetical protein n=1 Tax=uncultured Roseobacter sp. TaxID=114847 RepID=UPI00260F96B9|nr:hypothetical protein [uncultured Roseobacter sp.]